ncbi:MAG: glycine zipper 2TM domain-containing protein [Burkholderiales bacterium]|nr:glycine zipper 2TM domain-containing protein [Burkholderiales bacterium]
MMKLNSWRRPAAAIAACAALLLAGCNTPPAYSVSDTPLARVGRVESIQTHTVQNVPNAVGAIGGALIGGGLGSLIGGGTGKTVATVVGAVGGGFVGNELAGRDQTLVWNIGVRYDDGSYATIQQTSAPGLRIGDRVRVTSTGIELLRG